MLRREALVHTLLTMHYVHSRHPGTHRDVQSPLLMLTKHKCAPCAVLQHHPHVALCLGEAVNGNAVHKAALHACSDLVREVDLHWAAPEHERVKDELPLDSLPRCRVMVEGVPPALEVAPSRRKRMFSTTKCRSAKSRNADLFRDLHMAARVKCSAIAASCTAHYGGVRGVLAPLAHAVGHLQRGPHKEDKLPAKEHDPLVGDLGVVIRTFAGDNEEYRARHDEDAGIHD